MIFVLLPLLRLTWHLMSVYQMRLVLHVRMMRLSCDCLQGWPCLLAWCDQVCRRLKGVSTSLQAVCQGMIIADAGS